MRVPSGMKVKPAPIRLTVTPDWAEQWREKNQRKAEASEGARGSQAALQASIPAVASLPRRYAQVGDLAPHTYPLETPSLAQRRAPQDIKHDPTSVHKDLLAPAKCHTAAQEDVAQNPGAALPYVPPDSFRDGVSYEVEKWLRSLGEPTPAQRAAYSGTRDMSHERTAPASGAGPAVSIQPWTATKSSD